MAECSASTRLVDFPYLYLSENFKDDFHQNFYEAEKVLQSIKQLCKKIIQSFYKIF